MRQNLYITCAALALVFIAALASRFILFPSNVGLLGVIEPNHVVLGKIVLNKTTLEVYASYDYDCAVLGITVLTPILNLVTFRCMGRPIADCRLSKLTFTSPMIEMVCGFS